MAYSIDRIDPSVRNSRAMVRMMADDLSEHTSLFEEDIKQTTDPENEDHVMAQQQKLIAYSSLYRGATKEHDLVGFLKANEWYTGDQMPYAVGALEQASLLKRAKLNGHHLKERPLGIFALVVDSRLGKPEQSSVAMELMDDLLDNPEHAKKEMRIGLGDYDPLKPLLVEEYGFRPTRRYGQVGRLSLQLCIRDGEQNS